MIVVTGASRGLGRAICDHLTASGKSVFGVAKTVEPESLPFPSMRCDVSSIDDVKAVAKSLRRQDIEIEGLVNAAGIASMNLALMTPAATVRRIIDVNLLGTIYCCQEIAPLIIKRKTGTIVNFSTIAVGLGLKGESIYAASKAGVEGFTKAFAREMADFNVTVNCIAPGPIDTDLLKGITPEQVERIVAHQIIPKQFSKKSVADLVEILLDPRTASISGHVLHVGGL